MLVLFMPEHNKQGKFALVLCQLCVTSKHNAIEYEIWVTLEMKKKF